MSSSDQARFSKKGLVLIFFATAIITFSAWLLFTGDQGENNAPDTNAEQTEDMSAAEAAVGRTDVDEQLRRDELEDALE